LFLSVRPPSLRFCSNPSFSLPLVSLLSTSTSLSLLRKKFPLSLSLPSLFSNLSTLFSLSPLFLFFFFFSSLCFFPFRNRGNNGVGITRRMRGRGSGMEGEFDVDRRCIGVRPVAFLHFLHR